MNNGFNYFIILASVTIVGLFLGAVFINLNVKTEKIAIEKIKSEIDDVKMDLKRQKVEIATLTNPQRVLTYIENNEMKSVPLKKKHFIFIER
jgi:cell division protein FtsL